MSASKPQNLSPNGYTVYPEGINTGPALRELTAANKNTTRKLTHRVKLKGFDYLSHLFYVEGCLYKPKACLNKYVKIDIKNSDQPFYVNIDSLTKRLLLNKAIIEEEEKHKNLENLIEKRSFISSKEFIDFGVFDPEFADCFECPKHFDDFLNIYRNFKEKNNQIPESQLKSYVINAWKKFRSKTPDGAMINEFLNLGIYDPKFSDSFKNLESFKKFMTYSNAITSQYEIGAKEISLKNSPQESIALTSAILKKAIVAAWKNFSTMQQQSQRRVEIDGHNFILAREGMLLEIIHDHNYKTIGQGSSGTVEKVLYVTKSIFGAMKTNLLPPVESLSKQHEEQIKSIIENITREEDILIMVKDQPWAQQLLLVVNLQNGMKRHITKLYSGNLENWIEDNNHTPAERIECCKQLMQACKKMWDLRLVHYDLKPANILVDMSSGKPVFRIGDFGSARRLDHPKDQFIIGGTTPGYTHLDIATELVKARPKGQVVTKAQKDIFDTAAQKHDLYSLGVLFYQVLAKNKSGFPFEIDQHGRRKINAAFSPKGLEGLSKEIISLIESMVADPAKMPTKEAVSKAWDAV